MYGIKIIIKNVLDFYFDTNYVLKSSTMDFTNEWMNEWITLFTSFLYSLFISRSGMDFTNKNVKYNKV